MKTSNAGRTAHLTSCFAILCNTAVGTGSLSMPRLRLHRQRAEMLEVEQGSWGLHWIQHSLVGLCIEVGEEDVKKSG